MKSKSILIVAACLLSGIAAQAQNKYSCNEGWYVNVNGGINVPFMENNHGETIGATVSATVGKNLTPVWGLRGRVEVESSKLANIDDRYEIDRAFVAASFNLINAIKGCKVGEEGRFSMIGFAGPGYSIARRFNHADKCCSSMSAIAGGELNFSLAKNLSLNCELSGIINGDKLNSITGGRKLEGCMNVLAGFRYNF